MNIIKKSELKLVPGNELPLWVAEKVNFNEVDAPMLTNVMFDRMSEMGGVALSAPQVGLDMCMFVMGIDQARVEVFNPSIISYSKEETLMNEGSLTYPGILVIVKRPTAVTVEYYNKNGELQQNEFQGLTARIFQHAFDHLQGTSIKEKVSKLKWDMASKRYNNYKQKLVKKYTQIKLLEIKKSMEEQTNGNT
jgi:peptide deformylase